MSFKRRTDELATRSLGNLGPLKKKRRSTCSAGRSEADLADSASPHRSLLQIALTGSKGSFVALDPLSSSTSNLSWSGGMAHTKMLGRDHYKPSKPSNLAMGDEEPEYIKAPVVCTCIMQISIHSPSMKCKSS